MRVVLATDHAGLELKDKLTEYVKELGYTVEDLGAHDLEGTDDYPDLIAPAAQAVSENPIEVKGIILGGSGQGEAMVANRFKNVRCTVYYGGAMDIVKISREHNDANMLSLGARYVSDKEAKEAVKLWLESEASDDERHQRRIKKIDTVHG